MIPRSNRHFSSSSGPLRCVTLLTSSSLKKHPFFLYLSHHIFSVFLLFLQVLSLRFICKINVCSQLFSVGTLQIVVLGFIFYFFMNLNHEHNVRGTLLEDFASQGLSLLCFPFSLF